MPRFFLHVRDSDGLTEDAEGSDLPDLEAALAEAAISGRQIAADRLRADGPTYTGEFEIRDGAGRLLATVPFPGLKPAVNAPKGGLAAAERQIRAAEARIADQAAVAEGYEVAGDETAAAQAREALATMRISLAFAHLWLLVELASPDEGLHRADR